MWLRNTHTHTHITTMTNVATKCLLCTWQGLSTSMVLNNVLNLSFRSLSFRPTQTHSILSVFSVLFLVIKSFQWKAKYSSTCFVQRSLFLFTKYVFSTCSLTFTYTLLWKALDLPCKILPFLPFRWWIWWEAIMLSLF